MYLWLAMILTVLSTAAYAQTPGGTCSTAGRTATSANSAGFINTLYCNGTNWVASTLVTGNSATTCNSATAGALKFTGGLLYVCDGTNFQGLAQAGTTSPGVPGQGGTGYFVMSSFKTNGNIGGRAGGNTLCRNELTSKNWMGKPGTLDTNKIFAFLCENTGCNQLTPSSTYYYAVAGNTVMGGGYFQTDANGLGPNDQITWSASNRFGTGYTYWTDRTLTNDSTWGSSHHADNCNNWTDSTNTYAGRTGDSTQSNFNRWLSGGPTCDQLQYLICFVNP